MEFHFDEKKIWTNKKHMKIDIIQILLIIQRIFHEKEGFTRSSLQPS